MSRTVLKSRKLVDCKTLQEAIRTLDAKSIHKNSAVRKLVGLAYQMTEDKDKKATLEQADDSANHEMENHEEEHGAMGKSEKGFEERGGQKNAKQQKQNSEAREESGDEGLHGNPKGDPGSDVPTPETPAGKAGQKNVEEEPGTDQLGGDPNKENMPYSQMMPQKPSPDMLNAKIIDMMDPSQAAMSKVQAENAAGVQGREQMGFMQEAMNPVLKKIWADNQRMKRELAANKEAIEILQSQKDNSKITMRKPVAPGGNANQEALAIDPTLLGDTTKLQEIADDPNALATFRRDTEQIYL